MYQSSFKHFATHTSYLLSKIKYLIFLWWVKDYCCYVCFPWLNISLLTSVENTMGWAIN